MAYIETGLSVVELTGKKKGTESMSDAKPEMCIKCYYPLGNSDGSHSAVCSPASPDDMAKRIKSQLDYINRLRERNLKLRADIAALQGRHATLRHENNKLRAMPFRGKANKPPKGKCMESFNRRSLNLAANTFLALAKDCRSAVAKSWNPIAWVYAVGKVDAFENAAKLLDRWSSPIDEKPSCDSSADSPSLQEGDEYVAHEDDRRVTVVFRVPKDASLDTLYKALLNRTVLAGGCPTIIAPGNQVSVPGDIVACLAGINAEEMDVSSLRELIEDAREFTGAGETK